MLLKSRQLADFEPALALLQKARRQERAILYNEPPAYPRPVAFLQVSVLLDRASYRAAGRMLDPIDQALKLLQHLKNPLHYGTLRWYYALVSTLAMGCRLCSKDQSPGCQSYLAERVVSLANEALEQVTAADHENWQYQALVAMQRHFQGKEQ